MPAWLGRVHPKYRTPYAALIVHAAVSLLLVLMNFWGSGVQESFQRLLSLAVVLQLIPFLYMFYALIRIAMDPGFEKKRYGKRTLFASGASGLLTTTLGIGLAFFPAQQITSIVSYEIWMIAVHRGGGIFLFCVWAEEASSQIGRVAKRVRESLGGSYVERGDDGREDVSELHQREVGERFEREDISGIRPFDGRSDCACCGFGSGGC
jgi:hypothetical protein